MDGQVVLRYTMAQRRNPQPTKLRPMTSDEVKEYLERVFREAGKSSDLDEFDYLIAVSPLVVGRQWQLTNGAWLIWLREEAWRALLSSITAKEVGELVKGAAHLSRARWLFEQLKARIEEFADLSTDAGFTGSDDFAKGMQLEQLREQITGSEEEYSNA